MKTCIHGHTSGRNKAGKCIECHRIFARESARKHREAFPNAGREHQRKRREADPRERMLLSAKYRAKSDGLPFTITRADILIPKVCPWLGIPLVVGTGRVHANSPSLDRIIPALGYVPGNIIVLSHRANIIKQDATPEELMAVALGVRAAYPAWLLLSGVSS